jgi:uncharacterized glyoxalase superfamily protein PhnB
MTFKKLTPNLMVEDVAQSVVFYRDLLGFELLMAMRDEKPVDALPADGEKPLDWAMVQHGQVAFMFQQRQSLVEEMPVLDGCEIGASMTIYMELDGVDALYESLQGKADIIRPPQTSFYGRRELYLRDCNGYILALTEETGGE